MDYDNIFDTKDEKAVSIYSYLKRTASHSQNTIFIKDDNKEFSYQSSLMIIDSFSQILSSKHNIASGDYVGILISNKAEFIFSVLAVSKLGAVFVPITTRSTRSEVEDIIGCTKMKLMIYEREYLDTVKDIKASKLDSGGMIEVKASVKDGLVIENFNDTAGIFFTSGTTNKPKGVIISNKAILSTAEIRIRGMSLTSGMRQLATIPLCHLYSFVNILVSGMIMGHEIYLTNDNSALNIFNILDKKQIDIYQSTPTVFTLMLMSGLSSEFKLADTKYFGYATAPMDFRIISQFKKTYPHIKWYPSYGQTEACSTMAILNDNDLKSHPGSVGKAGYGADIKVIDQKSGESIIGKSGEVVVKKEFMTGYINADSKDKFTKDGFLKTNDSGYITSDGYLYLQGRLDNIIIINGTNINPEEVEAMLMESKLISEAGVVGKKTILGEQLVAFIVSSGKEKPLLEEEIMEYAKKNIIGYKCPSKISVIDSLPRTKAGKLDRKKLYEMANS
jgi:acyl-coenzyme A synthetase/AMP-(fatty) acid ligase